MVGTVHPIQTLELLYALDRAGFDGAIYFDTFPDATGLDPVSECAANIDAVSILRRAVQRLRDNELLASAIQQQDAVASQTIVRAALYGS